VLQNSDKDLCRQATSTSISNSPALKHLRLRAQDRVPGFGDVAVDHGRQGGIFLTFETVGSFELSFALHDPGVGGLLPFERLRLAMSDSAPFLNDDLGDECLGTIFASPSYYRTHRLS
jgi:hypothetical protein